MRHLVRLANVSRQYSMPVLALADSSGAEIQDRLDGDFP